MRIPSGDLSPARHRRYGGGYGRRRRRTPRALAVLLVAGLAGGAAYVQLRDDSPLPDRLTSTPCPTPKATTVPTQAAPRVIVVPRPQQVRLALLNGTARNGLASNVGNQLAARGFVITQATNAPAALAGPSRVSYGPGGLPAATLVSRNVFGSVLASQPKAPRGSVQVVLGAAFRRLATPAEVVAAGRSKPEAPAPTTQPAESTRPTNNCR